MEGLGFFPSSYPDEDFRSLIFRFHVWSGSTNFSHTNTGLFSVDSPFNHYMPRHLNSIFGEYHDSDNIIRTIIYENTLLPLLFPFTSDDQCKEIYRVVYHGLNGHRNLGSRLLANGKYRLIAEEIRYCPKCIVEDYERYGECYVHRLHQLEFVHVCNIHGEALVTRCPHCEMNLASKNATGLLRSPVCSSGHLLRNNDFYNTGIKISEGLQNQVEMLNDCRLIMQCSSELTQEYVFSKFKVFLGNRGYIKLSGRIRMKKFDSDFEDWVEDNKLDFGVESKDTSKMFRVDHAIKAIPLYLLVMKFLAGSVNSFIKDTWSYAIPLPFGAGPWECINPICPNFRERVIQNCYRKILPPCTGISGRFECPICGYTYRKLIRMIDIGENVERFRVETTGELWKRVGRFLEEEEGWCRNYVQYKLRDGLPKARMLAANIISSTDKFWDGDNQNLEMTGFRQSCEEVAVAQSDINSKRRLEHRRKILECMASNKDCSRSEICRYNYGAYRWLLKNDREWLEVVLPPRRRARTELDWPSVDSKLANTIAHVVTKLFKESPSNQIKKYTIIERLSKIEQGRLHFNADKLPSSIAILETSVESHEDYLVRHISRMIKYFKTQGIETIRLTDFLAYKSYRNCTERVRCRIKGALEMLEKQSDSNLIK